MLTHHAVALKHLEANGFTKGDDYASYRETLCNLKHDIRLGDAKNTDLPLHLIECATALYKHTIAKEGPGPSVTLDGILAFGPLQLQLLELLAKTGYRPIVLSAYRSAFYQALLFASAYLEGSLLDSRGRLTVELPGSSRHQRVDGAIDIEDSNRFLVAAAEVRTKLPLSLIRPYLSHPSIACEPWHWDCAYLNCEDASPPPAINVEPVKTLAFLRELANWADRAEAPSIPCGEHLFTAAIVRGRSTRCIGSKMHTVRASLNDSFEAVGRGADAYYLTLPLGFTPILDATIQLEDIGHFVYEAEAGDTSYLTPHTCCTRKLFAPETVESTLRSKLNGTERHLHLAKSKAVECALITDTDLVPCRFGLPDTLLERKAEAPALLLDGFTSWLASVASMRLPFFWDPYQQTTSYEIDPARFGLLRLSLVRNAQRLPAVLHSLEQEIGERFSGSAFWDGHLKWGSVDMHNLVTAYAFHRHSLRVSESGRCDQWPEWVVERIKGEMDVDDPNLIMLGHVASALSAERLTEQFYPFLPPSQIVTLIEVGKKSGLYTLARAQLVSYLALVDSSLASKLARSQIEEIIVWRESPIPFENGAFSGYENFLTALFVEALDVLLPIAGLSMLDEQLVFRRMISAVSFLRRLQYGPGTNSLVDCPFNLEGAVRFSLIDHRMRIDYGVHSMNASAATLALLSRL